MNRLPVPHKWFIFTNMQAAGTPQFIQTWQTRCVKHMLEKNVLMTVKFAVWSYRRTYITNDIFDVTLTQLVTMTKVER